MGLFIIVFTLAFGLFSAYKAQKSYSQKPAGLGDVTAPTAEEGREIPVIFGTVDLEGPNVCMFGDLKTTPIKDKGGKK